MKKEIEVSLKVLESYAKQGDVPGFMRESKDFYSYIGRLNSSPPWMRTTAQEMSRHYQSRYDQLKLVLQARSKRQGKDVGQLFEGQE